MAIAAGSFHSCALLSDGKAVCWGSNDYGQCNAPAPPPGQRFTAVSGGGCHSCSLLSDGTVVCWGRNAEGQCSAPPLPLGQRFTAVSAGALHSCALLSDGTAVCWGNNGKGQCSAPAPPAGLRFTAICANFTHSCAMLSNGTVMCWGTARQCSAPAPSPGQRFTAVSAGGCLSCGLLPDGRVVCRGFYKGGKCAAIAPPPGQCFTAVSAGADHACALLSDGTAVCWGRNGKGQCNAPAPPAGQQFTAVSAGFQHSCALLSDGTVACWGDNGMGRCSAPAPPSGQWYGSRVRNTSDKVECERSSKRLKMWHEQPGAPWWDVKLVADDGTEVHANRGDLAVCSAYFERLLCNAGTFADTGLARLAVPGVSGRVLREVAAHMHGQVALKLKWDSVNTFLEVGDRLQVESIKRLCSKFLERCLCPSTAVATHMLAVRHSCEGLQVACVGYFATHLAEVAAQTPTAQLQALSNDEMRGILQCTGAGCCSAALDVVVACGGAGVSGLAEWQLQRIPLAEWPRWEVQQVCRHPLARNCLPFMQAVVDSTVLQRWTKSRNEVTKL